MTDKTCKHCGNPGYHIFHFPPERKLEAIIIMVGSVIIGAIFGLISK